MYIRLYLIIWFTSIFYCIRLFLFYIVNYIHRFVYQQYIILLNYCKLWSVLVAVTGSQLSEYSYSKSCFPTLSQFVRNLQVGTKYGNPYRISNFHQYHHSFENFLLQFCSKRISNYLTLVQILTRMLVNLAYERNFLKTANIYHYYKT